MKAAASPFLHPTKAEASSRITAPLPSTTVHPRPHSPPILPTLFPLKKMVMGKLVLFFILIGLVASSPQPDPLQEYYFQQKLDHFGSGNLSTVQFKQRYFLDRTDWAGPESKKPLIVLFGGESPIDLILQGPGILNKAASTFGALVLYIEHRFYGMSIPFDSIDIALGDTEVRGCLTSEQALADYADIILDVKKKLLHQRTPVLVLGCSYSGMLAAWFRLKYPHITVGALASSAPIFYFDIEKSWEYEFYSVVSRDYKIVNEKCYERIKKIWDIIDNIGAQRAMGHSYLSTLFKTCSPLLSVEDLKSTLAGIFSYGAQYNGRFNGEINSVCSEIVRAEDDDILGGVARSVTKGSPCLNLDFFMDFNSTGSLFDSNTSKAWNWQICDEFIFRQGCGNNTMFQPNPFNLTKKIESCTSKYHVSPRLKSVSTYYGGYEDLRSTLKHFGSNIIFSNGLIDPYSSFGVLEDLSKTVVALTTKKGSHCLDFHTELDDDPKWLKHQRAKELKIMSWWIKNSHSSSNKPPYLFLWFVISWAVFNF